jgi:RNAse (barnase) inhibitor barstar
MGGPPIVVYRGNLAKTYQLAWKLATDGVVARVLRGKKMRRTQSLFDEVGAALQFPDYFGENWAALEECLTDLAWLPAEGYVLLIVEPLAVLADENGEGLDVFQRIMVRASDRWATPLVTGESWDRPAIPFHVVLQIPSSADEAAMRRWGIYDGETLDDFA